MSKITKIAFIGDMQRVKFEPGDTLVIRTKEEPSIEQVEAIKALVTQETGISKILVLPKTMDIGVLSEIE